MNEDTLRTTVIRFLHSLYGNVETDAILNIGLITPGRNGVLAKPFSIQNTDQIVDEVLLQRTKANVYLEVCLQEYPPAPGKRGNTKGAKIVPGFWVDIDIAGGNHKSVNYPETQAVAIKFVESLPWQPSLIVSTGGGLHVYYVFDTPFIIHNQTDRDRVAGLSRKFNEYVIDEGREYDWEIDNTSDLARLLRVPGTFNHKTTPPENVVTIFDEPDNRYSLLGMEEALNVYSTAELVEDSSSQLLLPAPPKEVQIGVGEEYPAADVALIESHCAWLLHCKDDVVELKEPEWFAACSIWSRCMDGRETAHERSNQYPKYCRVETDKKIDNSIRSAPVKCSTIESSFGGGAFCGGCFFRDSGKSPISLGNINEVAQAKIKVSKVLFYSPNDAKVIFEDENLEALGILKLEARGYFVKILDTLKQLGIPKGELKPALARYMAQSDLLIRDFEPYEVLSSRICINKPTTDGTKTEILSSFDARIVEEVIKDDGSETQLFLKIVGRLYTGEELPTITISAQEFEGMGWILHRWGTRAWYSGMGGTERHLRSAITHISKDYKRRHLFAHTGWVENEGEWFFLNEAGAIGAEGLVDSLSVDLADNNLTDFELPVPGAGFDLVDSIKKCSSFLNLAPKHITFPLFASIFRAALGEALPITFALFIVGATGTRKSEISGVAQAFWGKKFNGKNLPCNWSSSANALERITFQTKDTVVVIDDYVPGENPGKMNAIADRVFRSLGNQAGRQRMCIDLSINKEYFPRSLIVSTAEDVPSGQSLTGRMLLLELGEGDVNLEVLTEFQKLASSGRLCAVMFNYLKWLAPNMDKFKDKLADHKANLRDRAVEAEKTHTRTPDIIADLYIGLESYCSFAESFGAISRKEVEYLQSDCWQNLLLAASKQQSQQEEGDPCLRFRDLIKASFVMGKAHLDSFHAGKPPSNPGSWGWEASVNQFGSKGHLGTSATTYLPKGTRIGWEDGQYVYLNSDAAMKICEEVGGRERAITTSAKMLRLRLAERGFLAKSAKGELTIRKRIRGERRSVMRLHKEFFEDHESGDDENDSSASASVPPFQPVEEHRGHSVEIVDPMEKLKEAFINAELKNNFFPTT